MREIESPRKNQLQIDPDVLHQLLTSFTDPPPASEVDLGVAALRAGNFAAARTHLSAAITALDGPNAQTPFRDLMQLHSDHVRALLGRDVSPEHALGGASPTQIRDALPSLRRLVELSDANAQALDAQRPSIRPQHLMNLAHAQFRLQDYQASSESYLRAIQLLEGMPANNAHINDMLRVALNNYIFALQELPQTPARTQEIQRRTQQLIAVMAR